jgi:hypothetical protein
MAQNFSLVRSQALLTIGNIEQAILSLVTKAESLKVAITAICEDKIALLKDLREELAREIPAALAEVEASLEDSDRELSTKYGPALRELVKNPRPFQLFAYTLQASSAETLLELNYLVPKPQDFMPNRTFPMVWKDALWLYDIETHKTTQHPISVDFGEGGSYIELCQEAAICVGGYPPTTAAYELDLGSFQLRRLAPLSTTLSAPGLAKSSQCVYVFGGWSGFANLNCCEKYCLVDRKWRTLGDMAYPRAYFTPCHHRFLIYLVSNSSEDHRAIESFNSQTEGFAVLSLSLPLHLKLGLGSVAFVADGELCLMTYRKQLVRWNVESDGEIRLIEAERWCCSTQAPRVRKSEVLIACCGQVVRLSLETYTFLQT